MLGTDANLTQIIVVIVGFFTVLVTQAAQVLTYRRGRDAAKSAHEELAQATVNTYNAVAAASTGATVEPIEHAEPSTSEVPPQ